MTTITIPRELLIQSIACMETMASIGLSVDPMYLPAMRARAEKLSWQMADYLQRVERAQLAKEGA